RLDRWGGGGLPVPHDPGQETVTLGSGLVGEAIAGVAVVPDGGPAHEYPRSIVGGSHRPRDRLGAVHAATADHLLVGVGPSLVTDASTGQVHDRVKTGQTTGVEVRARPPGDLRGRSRLSPDEGHRLVALLLQMCRQRRADESGCSCDADSHVSSLVYAVCVATWLGSTTVWTLL